MAYKKNKKTEHPPPKENDAETPYPLPIEIDFERYAELLNGADPDDPDVRMLIETLFNIVLQSADIAWGLSPTQMACGKPPENEAASAFSRDLMLQLSDSNLTDQFAAKTGDTDKKGGPA